MRKLPKLDVYKRADIIDMIEGLSPVEEDVMSDIIAQFDSDMGVGLAQNKIVSVPYICNIRKNNTRIEFTKKKFLLKIAKRYMSKEDLQEYAKEVYREARKIAENKDRLKVIIRQNIISNRKKYERLILKSGKAYADMFILSISCFSVIPFDQDVEDAWQEIFRIENET